MQDNWDLKLNVTVLADDEESLVLLLRDVAKRIKRGNLAGLENTCIGVSEYKLYEQPGRLTTRSTRPATAAVSELTEADKAWVDNRPLANSQAG